MNRREMPDGNGLKLRKALAPVAVSAHFPSKILLEMSRVVPAHPVVSSRGQETPQRGETQSRNIPMPKYRLLCRNRTPAKFFCERATGFRKGGDYA